MLAVDSALMENNSLPSEGIDYTYISGLTFSNKRVIYDIKSGRAFFEGDIVLGTTDKTESWRNLLISADGQQSIIIVGDRYRWPNNIVPYQFGANVSKSVKDLVNQAVMHWEQNTHIDFVLRNDNNADQFPDFVNIIDDENGCWSYVGRNGGQQNLNLVAQCEFGAAVHELGHAFGLWHEHNREDRDNYVRINWENIADGAERNFTQCIDNGEDINQYDYGSIMHYGKYAFSRNGKPTITPLKNVSIGQRDGLSTLDIRSINQISFNWVDWSSNRPQPPARAIPSGNVIDSGTCYACSAQHFGAGAWNTHAGKLCLYNNRWSCFIGNGGREERYETYKVLVGDAHVGWEASASTNQPSAKAVSAGSIVDSGPCYVCRAKHFGAGAWNTHSGKLCRYNNRWSCFIGNGGREERYEQYETMISTDWLDWGSNRPQPPARAIPSGNVIDSGTCYACSARHFGAGAWNTHSGKLCRSNNRWSCFIGNGGREERYDTYKVLVGDDDDVDWEASTSANQPSAKAVPSGTVVDSGVCYVCRAKHFGAGAWNTHPGKLCRYNNRWSCFIGNGGREERYEQYETMVYRRP